MTGDKLEILSVDLLDGHRPLVSELRGLARKLRLEFGWHYLLDLIWVISNLNFNHTGTVVDAGAGVGIMQWYLASKGVEVFSVDRSSRANLGLRFRANFHVEGLRSNDLASNQAAWLHDYRNTSGLLAKVKTQVRNLLSFGRMLLPPLGKGHVYVYNQDLITLTDIEDESVDAVVALSSLEHNTPDGLREVVVELMRVLKSGGKLLATLGAARENDWFHEPSKGWNYSEVSLRGIFNLDKSTLTNYDRYDELFAALKDCAELRDNLAGFYNRSGDNGMPWGVWDPQYIPVGVCKVKP